MKLFVLIQTDVLNDCIPVDVTTTILAVFDSEATANIQAKIYSRSTPSDSYYTTHYSVEAYTLNQLPEPEEEEQPDPNDYPETMEGDADYFDAYWQGDYNAMAYHDDIGDR